MDIMDSQKRVSRRLGLYRFLQLAFGPFLNLFNFRQVISRFLEIHSVPLPWNHSKISIRCWSDVVAYLEIFCTGVYDPVFTKTPIETYCDLGCQSGFALFRLGSLRPPPVQGLLVDGNPYAIQRCKTNLLQSDYRGIHVMHGVVGWDEGEFQGSAPFVIRPNELECSLALKSFMQKGSNVIWAPLVNLEKEWLRLIGPRPCDLLKIDIEGAEKNILQKDFPFLDRVKRCVLEWHATATSRLEITALLGKKGFGEFEFIWDSPHAGVLVCRNLKYPSCFQN